MLAGVGKRPGSDRLLNKAICPLPDGRGSDAVYSKYETGLNRCDGSRPGQYSNNVLQWLFVCLSAPRVALDRAEERSHAGQQTGEAAETGSEIELREVADQRALRGRE